MGYINRKCDNCSREYEAGERNLKRGWGLSCSKSCAASLREKRKPNYNPERVEANNIRRETWNKNIDKTAEGYSIENGIAYDEFGEAMYRLI